MVNGVNIEEVKKYNASLKQYKEQSSRLAVEIEVNNKELEQLCTQLSAELGVEVTPDNVEQIYNEQVQKINNILETGNTILNKIESESNNGIKQSTINNSTVQNQSIPVTPVAPVQQSPFGQTVPGNLFNGVNSSPTELPQPGSINGVPTTPLFKL